MSFFLCEYGIVCVCGIVLSARMCLSSLNAIDAKAHCVKSRQGFNNGVPGHITVQIFAEFDRIFDVQFFIFLSVGTFACIVLL